VSAAHVPCDEARLWDEFCSTRGVDARNALTERYLRLAGTVAKRFAGRGVDYDDLYQVASLALISALDRYDCGSGVPFAAYAAPTLAGTVRNHFRDKASLIRVPRRNYELYAKLTEARETLIPRLGREPAIMEIAAALNIPEDDVLDIIESRHAASILSLDAPASAEEGDPATIGADIGVSEPGYERVEDQDQLSRTLAELTEPERRLLNLRYANQRSQRDTARQIGASQMRVSRMERRLLDRLREKLSDE
jgi:RNA polymerase sigma-B factor